MRSSKAGGRVWFGEGGVSKVHLLFLYLSTTDEDSPRDVISIKCANLSKRRLFRGKIHN